MRNHDFPSNLHAEELVYRDISQTTTKTTNSSSSSSLKRKNNVFQAMSTPDLLIIWTWNHPASVAVFSLFFASQMQPLLSRATTCSFTLAYVSFPAARQARPFVSLPLPLSLFLCSALHLSLLATPDNVLMNLFFTRFFFGNVYFDCPCGHSAALYSYRGSDDPSVGSRRPGDNEFLNNTITGTTGTRVGVTLEYSDNFKVKGTEGRPCVFPWAMLFVITVASLASFSALFSIWQQHVWYYIL